MFSLHYLDEVLMQVHGAREARLAGLGAGHQRAPLPEDLVNALLDLWSGEGGSSGYGYQFPSSSGS